MLKDIAPIWFISGHSNSCVHMAKKGHIPWNKGKKTGQIPWNKGTKGLQVSWNKGNIGKASAETRLKQSLWQRGDQNNQWKGDNIGYCGVHSWVRRHGRTKPDCCDICKKKGFVELSNRSGKYLRDFNDWQYLCRKCHGAYDKEHHHRRRNKS